MRQKAELANFQSDSSGITILSQPVPMKKILATDNNSPHHCSTPCIQRTRSTYRAEWTHRTAGDYVLLPRTFFLPHSPPPPLSPPPSSPLILLLCSYVRIYCSVHIFLSFKCCTAVFHYRDTRALPRIHLVANVHKSSRILH